MNQPDVGQTGVAALDATAWTLADDQFRTLRQGIVFLVATFLVALVGYVVAGWDWVDAFYMVTITIFGVGYGEVHPLDSPTLKLFTIAVIIAGCSSAVYVLGGVVQSITQGEVKRMLGVRQRDKSLNQMQDHTIICGYGRVGQILAAELRDAEQSLVIIDRDPARVDSASADGFHAILADATDDETLHRAGLLRASALASVLPHDATNVFITLSARDLSDSIRIIARAECPTTERKLLRSGATHVVMPAAIGASRIAHLATCEMDEADALSDDRMRMVTARSGETRVVPSTGQPTDPC